MSSLILLEHLLAQDAQEAAAQLLRTSKDLQSQIESNTAGASQRLAQLHLQIREGTQPTDIEPICSGHLFSVPCEQTYVVNDALSAASFAKAMETVVERRGIVALDSEWRPDAAHTNNLPSLLQLACSIDVGTGSEDTSMDVWLIDLQALGAHSGLDIAGAFEVDSALSSVLSSEDVTVLGFSFHTDLDKLSLLPSWTCSSIVRNLIDLSGVCSRANARDCVASSSASSSSMSLGVQLKHWTGLILDKSMQCSDWSFRPLSKEQAAYAAADAACLICLYDAIAKRCPEALVKTILMPSAKDSTATGTPHRCDYQNGADIHQQALVSVSDVVSKVSALVDHGCQLMLANECQIEHALELNALCFIVTPFQQRYKPKSSEPCSKHETILVIGPTSVPIDIRWLANWLGIARRRLRMATAAQCSSSFGATPGTVPPVPLISGIRVLALPCLAEADCRCLLASSGHPMWRLVVRKPSQVLPLLCKSPDGESNCFEWLPDPSRSFSSLNDACMKLGKARNNAVPGSGEHEFRAIVDSPLAPLARKLRMVGIDCEIAGEYIRADATGLQGLLRVKVDVALQDAAIRHAAALGRLIITSSHRGADAMPGVNYRLLAVDADDQFAELLEVFNLQHVVDAGNSRCGICNAKLWRTLLPSEVVDHVPPAVVEAESEFYQCGGCGQIFWAGEKYTNTMDSLKSHVAHAPKADSNGKSKAQVAH